MRLALLVVLAWLPAATSARPPAGDGAPEWFVETAALGLVAKVLAAGCDAVSLDLEARIDLSTSAFDRLERDGWSIDDPRLTSEATREGVVRQVHERLAEVGLDLPFPADATCAAAYREIADETELGRMLSRRP